MGMANTFLLQGGDVDQTSGGQTPKHKTTTLIIDSAPKAAHTRSYTRKSTNTTSDFLISRPPLTKCRYVSFGSGDNLFDIKTFVPMANGVFTIFSSKNKVFLRHKQSH